METEKIVSVGIDIGTSTSKMIISELFLRKVSHSFSLPKVEIVDRSILYQSPIISTPLIGSDEIDVAPLCEWVEQQYQMAQINLSMITSGAVIITGETATKMNARKFVHYLAERAGDFVVAVAGASLEAILAGKGSGAFQQSLLENDVILNVDIGGGTANCVFFRRGEVIGTITFHVGGRLIEIDSTGSVVHVAPSLSPWLGDRGFEVEEGKMLSFEELKRIIREMAFEMIRSLREPEKMSHAPVHSVMSDELPRFDKMVLSGGIGSLMGHSRPQDMDGVALFGDVGPLLASELGDVIKETGIPLSISEHSPRATVIGAGMQSTAISGSTIFVERSRLPIRNLPILSFTNSEDLIKLDAKRLEEDLILMIERGRELFYEYEQIPFAIYLRGMKGLTYLFMKRLAKALHEAYRLTCNKAEALVVICEQDMARAFGQALKLQVKTEYAIICIDQIQVKDGDYIDIGDLINESMVPVVIKTLAYSKSE